MGDNPFRRLFNLARELFEETRIQHDGLISGRGRLPSYVAYSFQWIQRLQLHLDAALNGAEQTGFGVEEVSRRINALAEPMRRLIHWQRDGMDGAPAPFLEALPEALRHPESAYIAYHTEEMLKAMHAVRELCVRAERSAAASAGSEPAKGEQAEGIDEKTRQERMASLAPADRKAYLSFEAALVIAERKDLKDWEAYKLLKEQGIPEDNQGELTDYRLPAKDTWYRQLRKARQALGEQKNAPRRGRHHGKSIAKQDQIKQPYKDDE